MEVKVTILWNEQVQTDRTIPNNKPGSVAQLTVVDSAYTLLVLLFCTVDVHVLCVCIKYHLPLYLRNIWMMAW